MNLSVDELKRKIEGTERPDANSAVLVGSVAARLPSKRKRSRPCHLVKSEPDAIPADDVEMKEEQDEDVVVATEPLSVQPLPSHFLRPPITDQFDGQTEFRPL